MKIKLITPTNKKEDEFWGFKYFEKLTGIKSGNLPLALPTLAALTPSDVEVIIEDENVNPINFNEKVDLVGITFFTCYALRAYEIADGFRKKGIKVILGGIHASIMPEEALQHADAVVIGEADEIWPEVILDFKRNNLQRVYKQKHFPDLRNSPIPRFDLVDQNNYNYFTVQIGRGCPYGCEFCSVHMFNGRQYRSKTIENVLREIKILKKLDNKKTFFFVDDNILINIDYAKQLFQELIHLKIKWWCQASINRLQDDEILDLMQESGCREVFVGFESVSEKSLESIGKTISNKVKEYEWAIKKVHQHGIAIFGSFMFGADTDNKKIFEETFNFIQKNNIAFAMLNILVPAPGTVIYKKFKEEGRILSYDWSKYNGDHVCFKPNLMTIQELQKGRDKLLKRIYSYKNMYKRFKNLWEIGVFIRDKDVKKLFTKTRIFLTIKIILSSPFNLRRNIFILKSLWNLKITSILSLILSLNFHDYSYKK
jgi:radical SAM superfamily enzyme YgiQ (UPF0313 family)